MFGKAAVTLMQMESCIFHFSFELVQLLPISDSDQIFQKRNNIFQDIFLTYIYIYDHDQIFIKCFNTFPFRE